MKSITIFAAIVALASAATALTFDPNGTPHIGVNGAQFITGECVNDANCASGCCAKFQGKGICSGPGASTQQGKQGCGFSAAPTKRFVKMIAADLE